jgi:hypothetical protein
MHLIIAPYQQLKQIYGREYPAVRDALAAVVAARRAVGIESYVYDPVTGAPDLAVAPVPLQATALQQQLNRINAALQKQDGIIESVWIIGGDQSVPFGSLANPMPDRDGPIPTDWIYGMLDLENPLARWPVGRTPDSDPIEPGLLAGLLGRVAAAHHGASLTTLPLLAVSAARWNDVSRVIAADWLGPQDLLQAPPLTIGDIDQASLARARASYWNVHGLWRSPLWYGQTADGSELTPVLHPAELQGAALAGSVVVTQACFGARLQPRTARRSMAIAFLAAGVDGFIGTHALAYGALDPPPGESDILAGALLRALDTPEIRLGDAVLKAHAATLREMLDRSNGLDRADLKTLISFVLYGDPALVRHPA